MNKRLTKEFFAMPWNDNPTHPDSPVTKIIVLETVLIVGDILLLDTRRWIQIF